MPHTLPVISIVDDDPSAEKGSAGRTGSRHDAAHTLQHYGMEVVQLSPAELQAFRQKTRSVYNKWASEIVIEPVRRVESIVGAFGG